MRRKRKKITDGSEKHRERKGKPGSWGKGCKRAREKKKGRGEGAGKKEERAERAKSRKRCRSV